MNDDILFVFNQTKNIVHRPLRLTTNFSFKLCPNFSFRLCIGPDDTAASVATAAMAVAAAAVAIGQVYWLHLRFALISPSLEPLSFLHSVVHSAFAAAYFFRFPAH